MRLTIGKATRQAAEKFGGPFTAAQIGEIVAPQFPEERSEWVALKVMDAITTQRKSGKIVTVTTGNPKVPGIYKWAAVLVTLAFTLTCLTAQRIYFEPGHILLEERGGIINVSADAQSGTLSLEIDSCEPAAPANFSVSLEL